MASTPPKALRKMRENNAVPPPACTCPHTLDKEDPGDPYCPRHGMKRPPSEADA